ncbi:hypothetical protein PV326_011096 [Microctonus aethiopoides]|nr:hypothetical protein PV326_011096 [Microctonus aethiopoides]
MAPTETGAGISSGVDSGYETTAELIFARLLTVVTMHCGCWWSDLLSIRHTKFVNEWLSENVIVVNAVEVVGITWDLLYYSQTRGNRKAPSVNKLRPRDIHLELLIERNSTRNTDALSLSDYSGANPRSKYGS